jgi:hypothetical protein
MAWDRRLGGSDRLAGVPAGPGPRHLVHRCIRLRPRGIWVGRSQTLLRSWMRETLGRQEPDSPASWMRETQSRSTWPVAPARLLPPRTQSLIPTAVGSTRAS